MPANIISVPREGQSAEKTRTAAPSLSEMQDAFQRAVMLGDDAVLNEILDNSRTDRNVLFGVYRHAYVARLIEVVRNDHPLLSAYLGDTAFQDLAKAYVQAHPSRNQNARWFSHGFPDFIADVRPSEPHVADLAELERALNDAFDAPDQETVKMSDLAAVPPESWADLIFEAHPSTHILSFSTNAHALWLALKNTETPPPVETRSEAENIIVWRHETTPKVRRMPYEEAMMWKEAASGVPFGGLCELVAVYDDPESAPMRAAQYLHGWIASGLLGKGLLEE
ncbi:MAG: DNA-binding domain-containing protein [Hyphomicrobium sp.]|uniref:HvfC/BufC family peptide modification chaperone n=1 Tax=Hyphomicrobium sp. TaxID=82 RepID=UPI0039E2A763